MLSAEQIDIITNPALLAFHQDTKFSAPAKPYIPQASEPDTSPPEYYAGASANGIHVFVINVLDNTTTKSIPFASVPGLNGNGQLPFSLTDMWTGKKVGTFRGAYEVSVAAHDTVAYLITPA